MSNLPPVGRKGSASSNQSSVVSSQMSKEDRVLLFTDPAMMGRRGCVPDPLATWAGTPPQYEYDEQGKPNFTSRGSQSAREAVPTLPPIARKGRTQTREAKTNSQAFSQTSPSPYNSTHSRTHSRSAAVTRAAPQAGRLTKDHYLHYVQTQRKNSPQKRPTATSTQSVSEDGAVRSGESRSTSRHRSNDGLKGTRTSRALAERTHDVDLHVLAQSYRHKMSLMLSMPVHPDAVPVVLPISENEVVRLQELKEAELARRERVAQRVKTLRKKEEEKKQREKEEEEARLEEEKERKEELRREREAMLAEARQKQKEQRRKERKERAQLLAALEAEKREREEKKKVLQATVKTIQTSRKSSALAHNTSARASHSSGTSLASASQDGYSHGGHSHTNRDAGGVDGTEGDVSVDGRGSGDSDGGVSDGDEYHDPEVWGTSRAEEDGYDDTHDTPTATVTSNSTSSVPNATTTIATAGATGTSVGEAGALPADGHGYGIAADDTEARRDASNDDGSNDYVGEMQMQPEADMQEDDLEEVGERMHEAAADDMSILDSIHGHRHASTSNLTGEHEPSEASGEPVGSTADENTGETEQNTPPTVSAVREIEDALSLAEEAGTPEQAGVAGNTAEIEASETEESRETAVEAEECVESEAMVDAEGRRDVEEEEFVVHGSDTDALQGALNATTEQSPRLLSLPPDNIDGAAVTDGTADAVGVIAGDVSVDMAFDDSTVEDEAGALNVATAATATTTTPLTPALPLAASPSQAAMDDDLTLGEDLTAGDLDDDMLSPNTDTYAASTATRTHEAVSATPGVSGMSTASVAPVQAVAAAEALEDDISLQLDHTDPTTDTTPAEAPLSPRATVLPAAQADATLTDDLTLGSDGDDASLRLDADTDNNADADIGVDADVEVAASVDAVASPVPTVPAMALKAGDGDDDSIGISLNDSLNTDTDPASDRVVDTADNNTSAGVGAGADTGTDARELEDDLTLDEHTTVPVVAGATTAAPAGTGSTDAAMSQPHGGAAASLDMSEDDLTLGDEPTASHTDAAAQAEVAVPVAAQVSVVTSTLPPTAAPVHTSVDLDGDLTLGSDATANTSVELDDDLTLGDDTSQGIDAGDTTPATPMAPAPAATAAPVSISAVPAEPSLGTDIRAPDSSLALDDDLSLDEGTTVMSTADDELAPLPTFAEKKQPDLDISTNSYELDFDMSTNLE